MLVSSLALPQVLTSTDIYTKAPEFYAWCMEVKNQARETMSKREEKDLFSEFAEDYNTSTLKQSERTARVQGTRVDAGLPDAANRTAHSLSPLIHFCSCCTSVSEKYYDLERWERSEAARGAKVDDLAGLTDEERMRVERQRARASVAAEHENARIQTMKLLMQRERESGTAAWSEIQKRQDASLQKSTFESIAKQREQDRRDAEMLAKQKRR